MTQTILVTGVNGFVGQHVAHAVKDAGHNLIGMSLHPDLSAELEPLLDQHLVCDLTDQKALDKLHFEADAIINLAGIAFNNPNESDRQRVIDINVGVHKNLYERTLSLGLRPRIVVASTAAGYIPNQPMPLTETSKIFTPKTAPTAYIASKLLMEAALKPFTDDLDIIVARPFNHFGPGQQPGFLVPDWAVRLRDGKVTDQDVNRTVSFRDFSDVRDVARAYILLACADRSTLHHDVYNISSGESIRGYDLITQLAAALGTTLPPLQAPDDVHKIYGAHNWLTEDTGWRPTIPTAQTVADFANWFLWHTNSKNN